MSRWGLLAVESWRNVAARSGISAAVALVIAAGTTAAHVTEYNATVDARRYHDQLDRLGYSTYLLDRGDAPDGLDNRACERMNAIDGVDTVVWLRRRAVAAPLHRPNGPITPLWGIGGDIGLLLDTIDQTAAAQWSGNGLIIERNSTSAPHTPRDMTLHTGDTAITAPAVAATLTSLGQGLTGNAFAHEISDGQIDNCFLRVALDRRTSAVISVDAAIPPTTGIRRQWVLANADEWEPPAERYETRPTRLLFVPIAAIALVVWAFALRIRRSDRALYAVIGLRTHHVGVLTAAEYVIVWTIGTGLAMLATRLALARTITLDLAATTANHALIRSAIATLAVGLIASWYTSHRTRTSVVDAIKER